MSERKISDKEIAEEIENIGKMTQYEMASLWRYAPVGHIYFRSDLPLYEVFRARFYDHFGGFTPEISKSIGWRRT